MSTRRRSDVQQMIDKVYHKRDDWNHLEGVYNFPCLIKNPNIFRVMEESNVVHWFFLGLDAAFCKAFLPTEDTLMTVICDEDERTWAVKFLPNTKRLSGGWVTFVKAYKFQVGQLLNLELVNPYTFRVRAYGLVGSNTSKKVRNRPPKPEPISMRQSAA